MVPPLTPGTLIDDPMMYPLKSNKAFFRKWIFTMKIDFAVCGTFFRKSNGVLTSGACYSAACKIVGKNTEVLPNNSKAAAKECPISNEMFHSQIVKISITEIYCAETF